MLPQCAIVSCALHRLLGKESENLDCFRSSVSGKDINSYRRKAYPKQKFDPRPDYKDDNPTRKKIIDPLSEARRRGRKYRETSIQNSLNDRDVINLLNISAEELSKLRRANQIIALNNVDTYVYPKSQFSEGKIINGIDQVIKELPIKDGWTQLIFLESIDPSLQGDRPIDRLRKGDISSVLVAAGNYGRQRPA